MINLKYCISLLLLNLQFMGSAYAEPFILLYRKVGRLCHK
jgi:hypothetical protein